MAARFAPDIRGSLQQMLDDERRHRATFKGLMDERQVTPCFLLSFWGIGGFILGFFTGCLGRAAIWVCTASVERTVHRHLEEQLQWLADRDGGVADAVKAIQVEELAHLRLAESHNRKPSTGMRVLDAVIAGATEILIWLSTYGASARVLRRLKA